MTPLRLVGEARRLVETPALDSDGVWPRAAVLLARQALEQAVASKLNCSAINLEHVTYSACLLALHGVTEDEQLPRRAAYVWSALSAATHHRGGALSPTAVELAGWLDEVEAVVEALV